MSFCVIRQILESFWKFVLMWSKKWAIDPRWFQVIFQSIFLLYGILFLHWRSDFLHYTICVFGCILFQYIFESIQQKRFVRISEFDRWGFSVLISAMSLCLLLKTNHWYTSLLASFITVAGKYFVRWQNKHLVNPSALGIVAVLLLTDDAWLSPGQWGSTALIFFLVITLGTIVITGVQRLDISLGFLITYAALLFFRQFIYLDWPIDFFIHSINTGSLLLFSLFMISDPKTSPNHPMARIIWAFIIALVSFYLSAFQWKYNTPIWVLVAASPLVPLLNYIFNAKSFQWRKIHWSLQKINLK